MITLFKQLSKKQWLVISPCVLLIIGLIYIQVRLDLKLPEYFAKIIKLIGVAFESSTSQTDEILDTGLLMLLYSLLSVGCTIIVSFISSRIGSNFSKTIRQAMYDKIDTFSMEEMNKFSTSSLITRTTNDVQQIQMVVIMCLRMAVSAPITAIIAITKIWGMHHYLTWTVVIGIVAIILIITVIFIIVTPKFKLMQKYTDKLNLVTRENLTGLRVVRAYNAEEYQEDKFEEVNKDLTHTHLFANRVMVCMMPSMQLVMSGLNLAIIWLCAFLINKNALGTNPIEGMAIQSEFMSYAMRIVTSFMMLTMMFIMIPRAGVSVTRVNQVLNTDPKIKDPAVILEPGDETIGEVEFKNVSFKYPEAEGYVLNNISFKAKKGDKIAFVGSTGSGKSTLINLVPRFYDVSEGEVLVNNLNVKDYQESKLHSLIGYVPQKGLLFSGTLKSNIKIGDDKLTDEEILEALDIAQATEFVSKLDDGLEHHISQGGKNVSGGQKQRLCIARAVAIKPQIYIFDDSFSALDYKTDRQLRRVLDEKMKDATSLIVAQRIGTILHADKIVVLDKGKMVGCGTHQELMKTCEVYQEMAYSQLSKEELANE